MARFVPPEKVERNKELFEDFCKFRLGEMTMVDLISKYRVTDTRIQQIAVRYAKNNSLEIPSRVKEEQEGL